MKNICRAVLILLSLSVINKVNGQNYNDVKEALIKKGIEFDSIILVTRGGGVKDRLNIVGYGIKSNKCVRLKILLRYDAETQKTSVKSFSKSIALNKSIKNSIKSLRFSLVDSFNADSLNYYSKDSIFINDGSSYILFEIRGGNFSYKWSYAPYFFQHYSPTRDREEFIKMCNALIKNIKKYELWAN